MPDTPYYLAYEARYQKVFEAGGDCCGHGTDDETLAATLEKWVNDNQLNGNVESLEQWKTITGDDYDTPQQRFAKSGDKEVEVWIPLVPARARNKDGYIAEMNSAGFVVDDFVEMDMNEQCPYSASINVHKP